MFAANINEATINVTPTGRRVPLPDSQKLDGFTVSPNNRRFTALASGRYYISYAVNLTLPATLTSQITINGVAQAPSVRTSTTETSYRADFIVDLVAGDIVRLELVGPASVTLEAGVGASLNIIRLA